MSSRVRRSWLYTAIGAVALFAVAVGFGRTYAVPMLGRTFRAPLAVHVHGFFAFAWILLFLVQPLLVRYRRVRLHRQLGQLGVPLAIAVVVTMIPAGMFQVSRDVRAGAGATGVSTILGIFTSGALFLALVIAGYVTRRDRESHARWMLLATLVVVWPAWFRFRHYFPAVPRPELWFALVLADLWIVVAIVHDRVTRGAVHPVLLWGGVGVIAEQSLEVLAFDSAPWRAVAQPLYERLLAMGLV